MLLYPDIFALGYVLIDRSLTLGLDIEADD